MKILFSKLKKNFCETRFIIVNFSERLDEDTKKLNQALREGWRISDKLQFEFSAVYEMWKWKKK